ncbi:hypothetical protein B0A49_01432 [Cryomyces minteri]|uniref:Uncharacterized protein n=1 Tax=Cryomyces minteri TaxID=331657 RepID=A0A4U0XX98_9PEZI|nr:hypothetical protein B0A49_01432 [Cryomyces minteri]
MAFLEDLIIGTLLRMLTLVLAWNNAVPFANAIVDWLEGKVENASVWAVDRFPFFGPNIIIMGSDITAEEAAMHVKKAKTSQNHQARGARVEAARVAAGLARVAKPYVPKPFNRKTTPATSAAALLAVATASAAPISAASKPVAAQSGIDGYLTPVTPPAQTPEAAANFTLPTISARTSPTAANIKQPNPYLTTLRVGNQPLEVYREVCRSDSSKRFNAKPEYVTMNPFVGIGRTLKQGQKIKKAVHMVPVDRSVSYVQIQRLTKEASKLRRRTVD